MKRVLCFGDSNTYGYSPFDGTRFPKEVRWSGILADRFSKDDVQVIEEGLVGRTTVFEDSVRVGRKGTLIICIRYLKLMHQLINWY